MQLRRSVLFAALHVFVCLWERVCARECAYSRLHDALAVAAKHVLRTKSPKKGDDESPDEREEKKTIALLFTFIFALN